MGQVRALLAAVALAACGAPVGTDGGLDAGADAGRPDAGTDAGVDAGTDAGSDAGTDAGPPPDAGPPVVDGIDFEPVALPASVTVPTASAFLPDGTLLVTSHEGTVHHLAIDGATATELGSFSIADDDFENRFDCGLLQIAVDPRWATNHFVYLGHCGREMESVIRRVTFDGATHDGVLDTSVEILRAVGRFESTDHAVGQMGFEPDGTMWLILGDKGTGTAQPTDVLLGALLRVAPSRAPGVGGYVPASGNAFDGSTEDRPEIYAWGLRHGWRATRDRLGRFWVGDVGESIFEEVNLVDAVGLNFGWSRCEGPCLFPIEGMVEPLLGWSRYDEMHPYLAEHPETIDTRGRVVWVGEVYRPDAFDRYEGFLDDRVPFGDACLGWVRGAWADEDGAVVHDAPWGHLPHVTSWVQGPDGYVYVTVFGSCSTAAGMDFAPAALYRVVPVWGSM